MVSHVTCVLAVRERGGCLVPAHVGLRAAQVFQAGQCGIVPSTAVTFFPACGVLPVASVQSIARCLLNSSWLPLTCPAGRLVPCEVTARSRSHVALLNPVPKWAIQYQGVRLPVHLQARVWSGHAWLVTGQARPGGGQSPRTCCRLAPGRTARQNSSGADRAP